MQCARAGSKALLIDGQFFLECNLIRNSDFSAAAAVAGVGAHKNAAGKLVNACSYRIGPLSLLVP